jgi:hypothetical protein
MTRTIKLFFFSLCMLWTSGVASQTLKSADNSQNAGKVEWLDRQITTGIVPYGVPVTREFRYKNVSSENLLILQVKSSCHCTVAKWDHEPVPPGQTGAIKITYDGLKEGDFYRIVSVVTNFDSMQSVPIALVGKVDKKPEVDAVNGQGQN